MFWPIFVALVGFGIACYVFGSTRPSPVAKATLFAFAGVFFMLTGAIVQANGLMIDWPTEMTQATVDGNTVTTIAYTTLSSSEGSELWALSLGMVFIGIVPVLSALLVLAKMVRGRRSEPEF